MAHLALSALFLLSGVSHTVGQRLSVSDELGRPSCSVYSGKDNATDDVPNILRAFEQCGHGGKIIFLRNETYHINSRLNPVVNDVDIDWQGKWLVSPKFHLCSDALALDLHVDT